MPFFYVYGENKCGLSKNYQNFIESLAFSSLLLITLSSRPDLKSMVQVLKAALSSAKK